MKSKPTPKIFSDPKIKKKLKGLQPGRLGRIPDREDQAVKDLRLLGALWESPVKVPFFLSGKSRFLPPFFRQIIRAVYGAWSLFFEKMAANKNQAFLDLLEQFQAQAERLKKAERRIEQIETRLANRAPVRHKRR